MVPILILGSPHFGKPPCQTTSTMPIASYKLVQGIYVSPRIPIHEPSGKMPCFPALGHVNPSGSVGSLVTVLGE